MRDSDEHIIARVQHWLETVVVGHNFCPFAQPVLNSVHYQILSVEPEQRLLDLIDSCYQLEAEPKIETALLIIPVGLEDFDTYLDQLALAEALMSEQGLDGVFQLASFHPDYCFDGVAENAAENYTNRSPYPIFHLLREDSLTRALATVSSPEKIPERNQRYAESLGVEQLAASLKRSQEFKS